MRMPRVRFTVRRMMIAVVIASIPLGAIARGLRLHAISREHFAERDSFLQRAEGAAPPRPITGFVCGTGWSEMPDEERERILRDDYGGPSSEAYRLFRFGRHHHKLGMKYWEAARHPWLPVEPDPPIPK